MKFFSRFLITLKENKLLSFSFLFVLLFFLLQHYWTVAWDFSSYVINARFFFNKGDYSEVLRAPLSSIFLGGTLLFGKSGEYSYIAAASIIFLYGNLTLSSVLYKKYFYRFKINQKDFRLLFFIFSLSPFVVFYGLLEGTELLSLGFFEIFLGFWLSNRYSGYLLGLAVLTRYNFLAFFVLLFFNKNIWRVIKDILLFFLVLLPWFIYNYLHWGNFFMSFIDSYNHNILLRESIMRSIDFKDVLLSINLFLPFFALGIFYCFYRVVKSNSRREIGYSFLFLFLFLFFLWDYSSIPLKIPRYLFNLSLPVAYFSVLGFIFLYKKLTNKKMLIYVLFLIWTISILVVLYNSCYVSRNYDEMYKEAAKEIIERNLTECYISSHHWVPVNYYTGNVYSLWMDPEEIIEKKGIVLIFPQEIVPGDSLNMEDLNSLPQIAASKRFLLLGKTNLTNKECWKRFSYSEPVTKEPCSVLSNRFDKVGLENFVKKICLLFNQR
jgi:hypothetical protein